MLSGFVCLSPKLLASGFDYIQKIIKHAIRLHTLVAVALTEPQLIWTVLSPLTTCCRIFSMRKWPSFHTAESLCYGFCARHFRCAHEADRSEQVHGTVVVCRVPRVLRCGAKRPKDAPLRSDAGHTIFHMINSHPISSLMLRWCAVGGAGAAVHPSTYKQTALSALWRNHLRVWKPLSLTHTHTQRHAKSALVLNMHNSRNISVHFGANFVISFW